MKEKNKINIEWLTHTTGDPFADAGGWVIKYLWEQPYLRDKSILELIEYVAKIYVENWGGKINAFFLNSTITQPAFKGERKISETLQYYKSLIEETDDGYEGYCRISGINTKLFSAGRDNHILSGSGTFINFHHAFQSGLYLSKEVLLRMFFVPLGLIQLSDKIALIHSNHEKVTQYFVFRNCRLNLHAIASGLTEGVLRSEFNNPANALFGFVDECINELCILLYNDETDSFNKEDVALTLYHFTNFGAGPEVIIYTLPAVVFKFYAFCHNPKWKKEWTKFIRFYYRNSKFKDAVFNESTEIWEGKKENADFDNYRIWRNVVLEKLMKNESILANILRWNIKHSFPFKIVETYQTIIRNMEKRTVEKIKQFAEFITSNPDTDFIKKCIKRLNGAKRSYELRQFLLKLNTDNYQKGSASPLITVEEYVDYLFPDGGNWSEIRDVLLIAIYQKIHEIHLSVDIEPVEEENETITENE
ncbi:type I-B CRISPR-associated protein Cas8b1/Cst1 [Niastella populi]|uniref:Type I-B CRISPR-associated protein Cas8b1/Cst1 n=1 Tax=Niastella populi TaxID=550983 RepID=A0A1V9FN50_9BACT|nr:type I-B CRISPR-associated protein Cas8b1/Cst1 [Niastella populi]OQP59773.1 type I-B CRISPR-associated protein Cas8b1/Cst1 [Niastella populi]